MRYAGISEKITSVGIYELDPTTDQDGVTAQLAAQMVWCFLDGFRSRTNDLPWLDRKRFTRFRIPIRGHEQELVFYKSIGERPMVDGHPLQGRTGGPVRTPSPGALLVFGLPDGLPGGGSRTAGGAPSRSWPELGGASDRSGIPAQPSVE